MADPSSPPIPRAHLLVVLGAALLAELLGAARYLLQGTGNIYTNTSRAFYVDDPLIGYSVTQERWVWLGLDVLAAIALIAAGAAICWKLASVAGRALLAGRRARGWLRAAILAFWGAGVLSLAAPIVPILALASGLPPHGAEAHLPVQLPQPGLMADVPGGEAAPVTLAGARPGRYVVLDSDRVNALTAQLAAGGEQFDARFAPLGGELTLTPDDLVLTRARLAVPAASIDTGIALRSSHARADLQTDAHPELAVELLRIDQVAREGDGVRFVALGRVDLMGRALELPIAGTVKVLGAEDRAALGVAAEVALLVNATLAIPISETPLDRSSFDKDTIPIAARVLLTPAAP